MTKPPTGMYFTAVALVLFLVVLFHEIVDWIPFTEPTVDDLADRHKEQLRVLLERSKLISGLAIAAFGATGALLVKLGRRSSTATRTQATWVFVLTGTSLLFGYSGFSGVIWMLDSEFFNLYNWIVRVSFDGQFLLFLAAAAALGHLFLESIDHLEIEPEPEMSVLAIKRDKPRPLEELSLPSKEDRDTEQTPEGATSNDQESREQE